MKRWLRWQYVLPTLAILLVVGVRLYTRSQYAADLVREKLQASLGTQADFDTLSVGLSETSLSSLRVREPDQPADTEPFLSAKQVDVDIAGIGAVRGKNPSAILVHAARLVLRFDRDGELLTRFPKSVSGQSSLSRLNFESSTLVIRQEGRPDTEFNNLNLNLTFAESKAKIEGSADDPGWGRWSIDGELPLGDTGKGKVTFKTHEHQAVTPELLRRVPFVNPNAWSHVVLSGLTTATIDLTYDARTTDVGYRVDLAPSRTNVEIPSIHLSIANAAGSFVAERGIITLKNVTGETADGNVLVNSTMDFNGPDSLLRFDSQLDSLQVEKLPRNWKLPDVIEGSLTGNLDLTISLPARGGAHIAAKGKATVSNTRVQGEAFEPIELEIRTDATGGVQFNERPPTGGGLYSLIWQAVTRIQKPVAPVEKYLHVDLKLREVAVAELMQALGAEVRIPVGGKLSAQLRLSMPESTPGEVKTYRLAGTITDGSLIVDGLPIEAVTAKLSMVDGKLRVTDLVGRSPKPSDAGVVRASGELNVEKPHAFQATVKVEKYPLSAWQRVQKLASLGGDATVEAEVSGTLEPLKVRSSGNARVAKLQSGDFESGDLTLRWQSDDDYLRLTEANANIFGGKVAGTLDVPLRDELPAKGGIAIENLDLAEVSKAMLAKANLRMEGKANGRITLRNPKTDKEGAPHTIADVELTAPTLKLQGITATKIKGVATYAAKVLKYELTGEALGGQVEVTGQYPPEEKATPPKASRKKPPPREQDLLVAGRLRLRNIQLPQLWEYLGIKDRFGSLAGEASLDFPFSFDSEGQLVGAGRMRTQRLTWKGQELSSGGEGIVRLSPGSIAFEEITLFMGEGVVRAFVDYDRDEPTRRELTISLSNVPAKRLFFLTPEFGKQFDLPIDGRLTSTIGKEWRGTGVLTSSRGKIRGVPVSDVRIPIAWTATPEHSRSELRVRDATAFAAGGQVNGRAEMRIFNDLPPRLTGDLQFRGVNISKAVKDSNQIAGNLHVSGKLDFSSEQLRKVEDLNAKLQATLGESQPFSLPIFSAIAPFLGLGARSPTTTVREGDVSAVLANGVWRVQKMTLTGASVDLYAEGTVSTAGRLNLDVIAHTRESPDRRLIQRIVPIPNASAVATTPLGPRTLVNLTGFIGRYVVYLDITGTIDMPVVRLQTLRTLTEDAARFFLFRFLAPLP